MKIRVGQGVDIHAFAENRPLILGGIVVPHTHGLAGHSDADVLLHAITDAILGALAWGDIGKWFPDTDMAYKDIDSAVLFSKVWDMASGDGWKLGNCDCTLLVQQPRIAPHIEPIRQNIARLFGADITQIGLKATTTEHLGFVGRQEGILAIANVVLLND